MRILVLREELRGAAALTCRYDWKKHLNGIKISQHTSRYRLQVKAGNPAISFLETRGFPAPPRDGCGFINFPFPTGKQAPA